MFTCMHRDYHYISRQDQRVDIGPIKKLWVPNTASQIIILSKPQQGRNFKKKDIRYVEWYHLIEQCLGINITLHSCMISTSSLQYL